MFSQAAARTVVARGNDKRSRLPQGQDFPVQKSPGKSLGKLEYRGQQAILFAPKEARTHVR
jgi:hypothetical protein